jgi:hypothetical protein
MLIEQARLGAATPDAYLRSQWGPHKGAQHYFDKVTFKTKLFHGWLLLGSGVVGGTSRDQACDEGTEQGFAAPARVVHDLEEAEIQGQLVLRDAPVRAQPRAQQ